MIRLSNSSTNTLKDCGFYYKLYYIDKIRPITTKSALFFGSAIDNALNDMLISKLQNDPKELDYKDTLYKSLANVNINGEDFNAKDCIHITYTKSDMDIDLLTEDDLKEIGMDFEQTISFVEIIQSKNKDSSNTIEDKTLYNRIGWLCLYRKGLLLLESYRQSIYPTIEYVVSIQEKVSLTNDNGDELTGVIDAVVKFIDDDKIYIADNKTSSIPYKQEDLTYSKQLATYAEYKQIPNVAYLVVEKKIRKTEPRTRTQILKGTLTEEHITKTFEDYEISLEKIRNKEFAKNFEKCYNFFGGKCPYFNYCKNKSSDGLVKLEEKK